jgi:hypothetical protein
MNFIEDYELVIEKDIVYYRRHNIKKYSPCFVDIKDLDEGVIINFPFDSYYKSYRSKIEKIPNKFKFLRSGVIPYTFIDGVKHFCMGIDFTYGTLTDFGGGVKKNENFLLAALRELYEESLGIFDFLYKQDLDKISKNSIAVYDEKMCIFFIDVKVKSIDSTVKEFDNRVHKVTKSENSGICWIPENIFFNIIKTGKNFKENGFCYPPVYKIVSDLLRSISNINEIL